MRWLLVVILLAGALPPVQAAGAPQAREEWMAGFVKLEEAGKAEDAGRAAAALEFYRTALATFREVQRKYPAWNPSLLTYRITFCEERIAGLQGRLGEETATMQKADLEQVVRAQVAKIHELAEKNQRLTTDLASASDALDRARREAAQTVGRDTDIRELVKERKELQDRLTALAAENTRLTEALRTLEEKGGLKALTERLQVELDQAKASKAEFEKGYETYKKAWENVKKRLQEALDTREKAVQYVGQLRERTLAAEQQAAASAEALAQAQREAQALWTAKEQAEAEAKAQAVEAAAAVARLETVRQENEQLRGYRDESVKQNGQVAELEKQVRELATAKATAVAQAEGLRADVEKSVAVAANLERDLAEARAALAGSQTELAQQRTAATAEVADLTKQLAQAAKERDDRAAAYQQAAAQWEVDRKQLLAGTASAGTAAEEIRKLQSERDRLAEQVRELTVLAAQAKGQPELAAALAQAKQDLAKAAAERTALEEAVQQTAAQAAALQAAQDRLAAAQAATEAVAARLAEAERKLTATEDVVASQKRLLAAGEERGTELAALGRQVQEREARIEAVQQELGDARKQLAEAQKVAAKTTEEARANGMEAARLRTRLEQAEKRAVALDEQLATQQRARTVPDAQANAERVKEATKLVEALEAEAARMKVKAAEQLDLLRSQEQAIGKLEQEKAGMARDLATRDGEIARLKDDLKLGEVSKGLAASLSDVDQQLATAKRDLQRAQNEREQAQNAAEELRARLDTARVELTRTRDLLAQQATPGAAGDLFREQIRRLTVQLEKESQRRRTLEELLSKGQDVPAVEPSPASGEPRVLPAPLDQPAGYAGATFPEAAERERRERQVQLLVRGFLRQGVAAEQAGNTEAARWNYGKVLENEPENRLATQRLGLIAAELGDDREAITLLKRAFRLDPDNLDVLLPLGFALVRQAEPDLAVSMLSRAVALEPDNPHAHRCLGIACSTLGWYDAAEVQFRRTDQLNPQDAENAFNLAVLLVTRQPPRTEEAKTWYLKARKLGASDPGLDEVFGLKPDAKP